MIQLRTLPAGRARHPAPILLWLACAGLFAFAVGRRPHGAAFAREAAAAAPAPATAPAAAPSVYNTLAIIATPAIRNSGLADLVAADLGQQLPGVRLVERERLDAAASELTAATLLGADAGAGAARLKLGHLVRADALVVLAEEEGQSGPASGASAAGAPATGKAGDTPGELQLVIADCRQGARLRVMHLPVNGRDPGALSGAVAAAIRDVRVSYPQGVRWIVGTSPFVSRNLLHDYDPDQRRFAAVLDNALSLQPGVAVLESQEARSIATERAVGGNDAAARSVPLIVEGEFEVRRPPPAATAPGATDKDATVAFKVKLSDSRGTSKTIERQVPLTDAGRFLGVDLPAEVLRLAPLPDQKPLSPEAQFKALAARADEFARLNAFEHSTPLREAALLVAPERNQAVTDQHRLLVREYTGLTQRPVFGRMTPEERAARERAMRDEAWEQSLRHAEYVIRNRLVNRHEALELLLATRRYLGVVVADGPPRWTQLLEGLHPIVWSLPPPPKDQNRLSPMSIDREDRGMWVRLYLSGGNADRICWSGGHVMTPAAYDAVMKTVELFADVEPYPMWEIMMALGQMPRFPAQNPGGFSFIYGPGDRPKDAALSDEVIDVQYDAFLSRLEKCGKPGYAMLARYLRLGQRHGRALNTGLPATSEEMEQARRAYESLEANYRGLRLGGVSPGENDYFLLQLEAARKRLESAAEWRKTHGRPTVAEGEVARAPAAHPTTMPTLPGVPPAVDQGNRLWFIPIPLQEKLPDSGELRDYGELYAHEEGGYWSEHLLPCADGLDVLWRSNVVKFLRNGVLDTVFVNPRDPAAGEISDVTWDGKRVWVARPAEGIAAFDARGRMAALVGEGQGLPPVSRLGTLRIEPLGDGVIFATGMFNEGGVRLWCAVITGEFDAHGLIRPARVEVVHKATAAMPPPGPGTRPSAAFLATDIAFNPTRVGQLRRTAAPEDIRGHAGPFILVGNGQARQLAIDLSQSTQATASVWFAPRPPPSTTRADYRYFDFTWSGSPWVLAASPEESTLYRAEFLKKNKNAGLDKARPAGESKLEFSEAYQPVYARPDPRKGNHPLESAPWGASLIPTPDALYLPGGDAWIRINAKTLAAEWLGVDASVLRVGDLGRTGFSSQYGLVAWGKEFCRLVVARERPPGAMEVKTVKGVSGQDIQVLWAGGRPTPSAEQLTGAARPSSGPAGEKGE